MKLGRQQLGTSWQNKYVFTNWTSCAFSGEHMRSDEGLIQ